jgi:HPt (histidine-containing phosphotransfer) domain-containing protein
MSEFETRMAALRLRFRERAAEESERIRAALAAGDRQTVGKTAHSLSGSAGLFGHAELGDAAEQVEIAIDEDLPTREIEARAHILLALLDGARAR